MKIFKRQLASTALFAASAVLALLRELLLGVSGTGEQRDGYFTALLVIAIVASFGSTNAAAAALYSRLRASSDQYRTVGRSFVVLWSALGVGATVSLLLTAYAFSAIPALAEHPFGGAGFTARMLWGASLNPVFSFAAGAFTAVAYSKQRVVGVGFGDIGLSATTLFGAMVFTIWIPDPVYLGLSWTVGSLINAIASWYSSRGSAALLSRPPHTEARARPFMTIALTIAAGHLGLILERLAAAITGAGSVGAIGLARRVAMSGAGIASSGSIAAGLPAAAGIGDEGSVGKMRVERTRDALTGLWGATMAAMGACFFLLTDEGLLGMSLLGFAALPYAQAKYSFRFQLGLTTDAESWRLVAIALLTSVVVAVSFPLVAAGLPLIVVGISAVAGLLVGSHLLVEVPAADRIRAGLAGLTKSIPGQLR